MVKLVSVLVYLGQMCNPVLVVEKFHPVCSNISHYQGNLGCHLEFGIQEPEPEWDGDSRVHHMKEDHQGVSLGVEEAPDYMGQGLMKGKLFGGGEGMDVDAEGLVQDKEAQNKDRSNGYV